MTHPHDGIEEPEVSRRVDGSSVYTVADAALHTSQRIRWADDEPAFPNRYAPRPIALR